MTKTDALALIFARNAFYRRLHYLAFTAFILNLCVIGILSYVLFFLLTNPVRPLYFATDNVGRLVHIVPVNVPNMTTDQVIEWTEHAVEEALSYDYINYRAQLQTAQKYFTRYGWSNYMTAIQANNNLIAIKQRSIVAIAKVVNKPSVYEGILGGAYAWKLRMPVLVTYAYPPYDSQSYFSNALDVSVVVQRQPVLQSYQGLGILQIIASLVTTGAQPQAMSDTPTE